MKTQYKASKDNALHAYCSRKTDFTSINRDLFRTSTKISVYVPEKSRAYPVIAAKQSAPMAKSILYIYIL